ncbi:glycosyltransferase family 9 protein [Campylobacter sp. RM16187]|uniref:glycosyltransferase family 9 protein n=1 Tax=Campylobacter sp. RM16187 TaxID=1660063 RepID=UPI0021B5C7A7|nr:glycosyltransferase family 9 protein [Campylobacter sp. RM16187]QKG29865.1 glycosyltransferase, family 9 [Campylobacter sp. RM16187]
MKILLIRNDNIGDLICTTPAIEALRHKFEDAKIDIVVNSLNACVVIKNPFLNKIYIYTKPKHKKRWKDKIWAFLGKCKILFQIYRQNYDAVVIFRSSYSPSASIFARAARAKRVIGVDYKYPKKFITDKIKFGHIPHEVMLCFDCLAPLGAYYNSEKTLFLPKNVSDKFKDFVFFHISSRISENQLSISKIEQIAKFLKEKFADVVLSSENVEFGERASRLSGVDYLQTSSMDELANYLCKAKFLLTLDGGVAHLGPALGLKTFVIFGKTNLTRWKPWGDDVYVLQDNSGLAENVKLEDIYEQISKFS